MHLCRALIDQAPAYIGMVSNTELIAVHEDSLSLQAKRIMRTDGSQIWWRPLKDGSRAVCFYNTSTAARTMSISWSEILLNPGIASVRDLWQHKDLGTFSGTYTSATIGTDSVEVVKITGSPQPWEAAWNLYQIEPQYANCPWKKYWQASWGPYVGSCDAVAASGPAMAVPREVRIDIRADGAVRINASAGAPASVTVMSPDGRLLLQRSSEHPMAINLKNGMPRGVRIVTIRIGGLQASRTVTIE
jgi:hypothetical protein